jgi:hypothetical protein
MEKIFEKMKEAIKHLEILHNIFMNESNFNPEEKRDYAQYKENEENFKKLLNGLNFSSQLYDKQGRQMILADLIEYIFLGRGYYSIRSKEDKENFVRVILHFVNLLMCYEVMTVSDNLRKKVLEKLANEIPEIRNEDHYTELKDFSGTVGLKRGESEAPEYLNRYFDSILPKTAGGLWHELLVYVFLIRTLTPHHLGNMFNPSLSSRSITFFGTSVIMPCPPTSKW